MSKTIRLLVPILSGNEQIENNCVLDATNEAADLLLNHSPPYAELTDATERHPTVKLLHTVTLAPVNGTEKHPLPDDFKPTATPAQFTNHADELIKKRIKSAEPTLQALSKEPVAAKVEVSKADVDRAKKEKAEVDEAAAIPVVVVKETKAPVIPAKDKDKP